MYIYVLCLATQSCPTFCNPMDCSLRAPLSMGILWAGTLEQVSTPSSRGSSQSRDWTQISQLEVDSLCIWGFPGGSDGKESACWCRFDHWVGKIPWKRKWQSIPVFLPGKSQGQRSLMGYSWWGYKRVRQYLATKQQTTYILYISRYIHLF